VSQVLAPDEYKSAALPSPAVRPATTISMIGRRLFIKLLVILTCINPKNKTFTAPHSWARICCLLQALPAQVRPVVCLGVVPTSRRVGTETNVNWMPALQPERSHNNRNLNPDRNRNLLFSEDYEHEHDYDYVYRRLWPNKCPAVFPPISSNQFCKL